MKTHLFTFAIVTIIMISACNKKPARLDYPPTAKVDTVDIYFGTEVPDPYRWLEDDNSEATKEWVNSQNALTKAYLEQIPFRDAIKERLTKVWDYATQSVPKQKGNKLFYYRHDGKQNHAVLYVKSLADSLERVLIDPNLFSGDGTTSLAEASVSPDGRYVAYAVSKGGSDWREVFVRDVETSIDLADHDDRVVPAHSFKYIAQLQESYKGNNPVLIRIETKAGHGAGKPLSMQIDEVADKWAFTLYNMNEEYLPEPMK